jgi:hypothetical protein
MNIGANTPEEHGDYFAWGETVSKDYFNWSNYKWCNGSICTLTKYCCYSRNGIVDNRTELESEDDAAYVNWGPSWCMPTSEQHHELVEQCIWTWTTLNDVPGCLFTGPNGNTLFLPAAGSRWNSSLNDVGSLGCYWSCTIYDDDSNFASWMRFDMDNMNWTYVVDRASGLNVRAVRVSQD